MGRLSGLAIRLRKPVSQATPQFRTEFDVRQDCPMNRLVCNLSDDSIRNWTLYLPARKGVWAG